MPTPLRRLVRMPARIRCWLRQAKNWLIAGLANAVLGLLARLSLERALRVGEAVGDLAYRWLARPRRLAMQHLELTFGDQLPLTARRHLARASFVNVARSFCEIAKIDAIRAQRESYFEVEGWEHLEQLRTSGRGCMAITGDIGNWELLVAYLAWCGMPIAAMARRVYDQRLNSQLVEFRKRQGVETILGESPSAARQILSALTSNAILAVLIDQDTHVPSVSVPFFGRLARTPLAAASLAVRQELPVLAAFIHRRGDWGCRIVIRPPIEVAPSGDWATDIRSMTAAFNAAIEAEIRTNPADWVWWQRRWRRSPLARLDIESAFPYTDATAVERGQA